MRGRAIWGVVVPMDSIWRTGANNATLLTAHTDIRIGNSAVPKGTYTVYSRPSEKSFTLIISKKSPGFAEYDQSLDLVRIEMMQESTTVLIDPFRMWFEPDGPDSAMLKLGWSERVYSVGVSTSR